MSEKLSADLNIIQSAPIELELLDGDLNIIQKLDDEPNDVGGLTSAELKAKFDESGNIIKKYINETLIPAVLAEDATEESRKQAEAARVAAEQVRQTNEETRKSNEAARQNAESQRVSAENARNVWEDYSASKAYAVGNKVAYGGSSYLCIKPCTGIAPPNAEYWRLIAAKGNDGKGAPSDGAPKAAGTANAGVLETYSRSDHVHPQEVSDAERTAWNGKQAKLTGTAGQVVMINAQGAAEAQDAHFGFSPRIVVTAPTGSSAGSTRYFDRMSATRRITAPMSADDTARPLSSPPIMYLHICGASRQTKPIVPMKDITSAVPRHAAIMQTRRTVSTFTPRLFAVSSPILIMLRGFDMSTVKISSMTAAMATYFICHMNECDRSPTVQKTTDESTSESTKYSIIVSRALNM